MKTAKVAYFFLIKTNVENVSKNLKMHALKVDQRSDSLAAEKPTINDKAVCEEPTCHIPILSKTSLKVRLGTCGNKRLDSVTVLWKTSNSEK